jgi:hypothetical protein
LGARAVVEGGDDAVAHAADLRGERGELAALGGDEEGRG